MTRTQYFVRIPSESVTYPKTGAYSLSSAKSFARIGSKHGRPREVRKGSPRGQLVRRYVKGERVWPVTAGQAARLSSSERPKKLTSGGKKKMVAKKKTVKRATRKTTTKRKPTARRVVRNTTVKRKPAARRRTTVTKRTTTARRRPTTSRTRSRTISRNQAKKTIKKTVTRKGSVHWMTGVVHPVTGKQVGGHVRSMRDSKLFKRSGKRKAGVTAAKIRAVYGLAPKKRVVKRATKKTIKKTTKRVVRKAKVSRSKKMGVGKTFIIKRAPRRMTRYVIVDGSGKFCARAIKKSTGVAKVRLLKEKYPRRRFRLLDTRAN